MAELTGRGVFYGSAATEAPGCTGQDVYIVGGANSAGQAAVFFSRHAATVSLLVRGREPGGVHVQLPDQAAGRDRQRRGAHRHRGGRGLRRRAPAAAGAVRPVHRREADRGRRPRCSCSSAPRRAPTGWTVWCSGTGAGSCKTGPDLVVEGQRPSGWPLDRDPYHLESSVPGVFVAGDVRADSVKRVASAVGEGAMAVTLVHRYLAEQMSMTDDDDERASAGRGRPADRGRAAGAVPVRRPRTTSSWPGSPTHGDVVEVPVGRGRRGRGRSRRPASTCCCPARSR